jgi:hypothetical protein
MSDTEEVVITRANRSQLKVNTKPEIAREKLKEKRERLKKEKENMLIEEAKKRLISESEKKQQEEAIAKQAEEDKKKSDPTYALLMKMEQMMAMMGERHVPVAPGPLSRKKAETVLNSEVETVPVSKAKRVPRRKVEIEAEGTEEKPKRKPRAPKEPKTPKPIENVPKRRKKVVYLQQDPIPETSTQFVGYDIAPPAEPIQYQPSSGLLSAMMGRRNMNSFYNQ